MKKIIIILMALVLNPETREVYLSLDVEVRGEIDKQMASLNRQFANNIDRLSTDVSTYAEARTSLPNKQVLKQLNTLQRESGGMFDDMAKAMVSSVTDKVFEIDDDIFFKGLETEADFNRAEDTLTWQAMFVNTCPSCLRLHGLSRKRKFWERTGTPNNRDTFCTIRGSFCRCLLVPTETNPSLIELREPIKIQSARIRKAEKKRGKDFAESTKLAFLGQINNPKSTIFDLRKVKKVKT